MTAGAGRVTAGAGRVAAVLLLVLGLVLALGALLAGGGSGPRDLGSDLGRRAGFAEGSSLLGRDDRALTAELDGIAATGARWLRVDVDWSQVEPEPGQWAWDDVDRVVQGARGRGLAVLALLTYTPAWARGPGTTDKYPPRDVGAFADFARAAVRRYGDLGVRHWEIWNEPNSSGFWAPRADPARYVALLRGAARVIRHEEAGAVIVSGGLAPSTDADDGSNLSPGTFLERLYDAGGRGAFDALGHHPYNYPHLPLQPASTNSNAFAGVTPQLYDIMRAHGDGAKHIWGTEMGAPSVGGRAPDSFRAYLVQAYEAWVRWPYTGPLLWYSYRDAGTSADPEDHFGLVSASNVAKGEALRTFTALMHGHV